MASLREKNEWDDAAFYRKWSYLVANRIINLGQTKTISMEELMDIPRKDDSRKLLKILKRTYQTSQSYYFIPRLMVALIKALKWKVFIVSVVTVVVGLIRISQPLVLIFFLDALQSSNTTDAYLLALLLSVLSVLQAFLFHAMFFYASRVGWNFRNATTALIYERLFSLEGSSLQTTLKGKLVNLISNDVARFDQFGVFGTFFWESHIEVILILLILAYILDFPSAVAGVGFTLLTIPLMMQLAKQFAHYRHQTAQATDARVRHVTEIIEGISTVKSYAWESPFFQLIGKFRSKEEENIYQSQVFKAVNQGIIFATPPVVSFFTFLVFWSTGGELTIAKVFSTMALLQVLRMTIGRQYTRAIETCSEAVASCKRIEAFLDTTVGDYSDDFEDEPEDKPIFSRGSRANDKYQLMEREFTGEVYSQLESGATHLRRGIAAVNDVLLIIRDGNFYYAPTVQPSLQMHEKANNTSSYTLAVSPVLKKINLSVRRGEVLTVVGPVGCGKSTLLLALLGEMSHIQSEGSVSSPRHLQEHTRIAYCAQTPWIIAASVKANITLANTAYNKRAGQSFKRPTEIDERLYAKAVESCCIVEDLVQFPAYDDSEIGERGISMSGGQRARISLARAVYSDADIYLLDDPLSAVDAHVGKALMHDCIKGCLAVEGKKAVVLVTHQLQYLQHSDKILLLSKTGEQLFFGSYDELIGRKDLLAHLDMKEESMETSDISESNSSNKLSVSSGTERKRLRYNRNYRQEQLQQLSPKATAVGQRETDIEAHVTVDFKEFEEERRRREIVSIEDRQVGDVSFAVYYNYIFADGRLLGFLALSMIFLAQGIAMITEYWLKFWATESFGDQDNYGYVLVYAGLVLACIIIGYYRALSWFYFSLVSSSRLHKLCLWAVLHSPLRFFVSNPLGRILNRLTKDQNQVDESLPVTFFMFLEGFAYCLGAILLVCITIPYLIVLIPVLAYAFNHLRLKYMKSSREIKRLEAISRSPVYSDFSATLEGLVTLRAYQLQEQVTRNFLQQLNENGKAWYSFSVASRWLGFRLDMECTVLIICVAFLSVALMDSMNIGLIGFCLNYTMALAGVFQWTVRLSAEVETEMTAIERIHAYSELPPEDGYSTTIEEVPFYSKDDDRREGGAGQTMQGRRPAEQSAVVKKAVEIKALSQSVRGEVTLSRLTVTYRPDLDPVLEDLSLQINAGEKIGVCGRTGSGKSSTLLALLRLNIIVHGDILIDGQKSLLQMDLETARSLISIIPQEPHLFSGSVRFNLDPFQVYSDAEVWQALESAQMRDFIARQGQQLEMRVDEAGRNFSVGQRQLLSLARAILRGCKIVLMDEVTASIDFQTDRLIQQTIRTSSALKEATIITIAHRLRTIADADRILVIDKGRVAEYDSPEVLLQREDSLYRKLAIESGEFEEIERAARKK